MPKDALVAKVNDVPLVDHREAEKVFRRLKARSPITSIVHAKVEVTERLWAHLKDKEGPDFQRRAVRIPWLEPTLVDAGEVWADRTHQNGAVYLGQYRHVLGSKERVEFFAVCVNHTEFKSRPSVATVFPLRRLEDVEKLRKTMRIWP